MHERHMHTWYQWRLEKGVRSPVAGVPGIVSCLIWVLKIRPWSSARTVSILTAEKSLQALLTFNVCVFVCHSTWAEGKGHLYRSQVSLPPYGYWGSNLGLKLGRKLL